MKCFTVTTKVEEGIRVGRTTAPFDASKVVPAVLVGEHGRGRKLHQCPVEGALVSDENARIDRADLVKRGSFGPVFVPEEVRDDRRAIVLVAVPAGFRGGVRFTAASKSRKPCPARQSTTLPNSECFEKLADGSKKCQLCGTAWIEKDVAASEAAGEDWWANQRHPDSGEALMFDSFPPEGVTVVAEGYVAQGDAGRMGGNAEYLLILKPGAGFRARRAGRLYGAPAEVFVRWDGENLVLSNEDPSASKGPVERL